MTEMTGKLIKAVKIFRIKILKIRKVQGGESRFWSIFLLDLSPVLKAKMMAEG